MVKPLSSFHRVSSATGVLVASIGLFVLAVWVVNTSFGVNLLPSIDLMHPQTALSFTCVGIALVFLSNWNSVFGLILGSATGLLGAAALVRYLVEFKTNLGTTLLDSATLAQAQSIVKTGLNTELAFVFAGLATVFLFRSRSKGSGGIIPLTLGASVILIGAIATLGHLIGAGSGFQWAGWTKLSAPTGLCLIILGSGLMALSWSVVIDQTRTNSEGAVGHRRRVLGYAITTMSTIALLVGGLVLHHSYRMALEQRGAELESHVRGWSELINASFKNQRTYAEKCDLVESFEDNLVATIGLAHESFIGFGRTGEFVLAKHSNDSIRFLIRHRHSDIVMAEPISMSEVESAAEPMRRALSGGSGTIMAHDYRNEHVLAVYSYLPLMDWGIVAKIDVVEIRRPFVQAAYLTFGVALVVIIIGSLFMYLSVNPLIVRQGERTAELSIALNKSKLETAARLGVAKKLKESEARFRSILYSVPDAVVCSDSDGFIALSNQPADDLFGFGESGLIGRSIESLIPEVFSNVKITGGESSKRSYSASNMRGGLELKAFTSDCRQFPVEVSLKTLNIGADLWTTVIIRDLTERNKIEQERKQRDVEDLHANKLEAVGSLASGIAHEINTPIQFVGDNTRFISSAIDDLLRLATGYRSAVSTVSDKEALRELQEKLDEVDKQVEFDYLKEEAPLAISQTLEGVDRVTKIVRAMKEFSHAEGESKALADINKALRSALVVAGNEIKYVADVVETCDEQLPLLNCHIGDLNQAFLNLLINAAHAMSDVKNSDSGERGTIGVSTIQDGDDIVIKIRDTGSGIPANIRDRVFDHFFTTKSVGVGTGQGLAICRQIIVDKHGGSLTFETATGEGTTFIIRLPMSEVEVEDCHDKSPVC